MAAVVGVGGFTANYLTAASPAVVTSSSISVPGATAGNQTPPTPAAVVAQVNAPKIPDFAVTGSVTPAQVNGKIAIDITASSDPTSATAAWTRVGYAPSNGQAIGLDTRNLSGAVYVRTHYIPNGGGPGVKYSNSRSGIIKLIVGPIFEAKDDVFEIKWNNGQRAYLSANLPVIGNDTGNAIGIVCFSSPLDADIGFVGNGPGGSLLFTPGPGFNEGDTVIFTYTIAENKVGNTGTGNCPDPASLGRTGTVTVTAGPR